ncbi:MAG TPA: hypothetical protein VFE58_14060 [Tepidisphaeraceae bacterium]|jgi:hypothetical protein|nr:hypothetical protein [Tepidisphaeraceae bacterium]
MSKIDADLDEETDEASQEDAGSDLTDALAEDEASFITEEKKPVNRTSVLIFGVILLGAAGYYLMYARTGPQTASAAVSPESEQADQTINQFLSAGDENLRVMRQLRQTTDKVVAQFKNAAPAQVPLNDLQANPFKYAQLTDDASAAAAAKKKHEEERQIALTNVQTLQLQSILHSETKRACMINNQLYAEGATVSDFTIEKISVGSVIVKSGPFRFELKMQH